MADLLQRGVEQEDSDGVIADHAGDIFAANGYARLAAFYWGLAWTKTPGTPPARSARRLAA
jgi:hypothetical protein